MEPKGMCSTSIYPSENPKKRAVSADPFTLTEPHLPMIPPIWNFGTVCAAIESGSGSFEREFVALAIQAFGARSWDCGCMRQRVKERAEHASDLLISMKDAERPRWRMLVRTWEQMGTHLPLVEIVKDLAKKALFRCRTCRRWNRRRGPLGDYDLRPRDLEEDPLIKARLLEKIWMDVEKLIPDETEREAFLLYYRDHATFDQIAEVYKITRDQFDNITRKVRKFLIKLYNPPRASQVNHVRS